MSVIKFNCWFYPAAILLLMTACDPSRVFDDYTQLPEKGWNYREPVTFSVPIIDTITGYNLYINIRHASGYPYSNLFLFITILDPLGNAHTDTLECILADEHGDYLGSGIGDLWDIRIPYKKNHRFGTAGSYSFKISQGMRVENLPLILDIGLRVERHTTDS